MPISITKPKEKGPWVEYFVFLVFITAVVMAVDFRRPPVFEMVHPSGLQVALADIPTTLNLNVIGHKILDANGNPRIFMTQTPFMGSDNRIYAKIPKGETLVIGGDGEPILRGPEQGLSFIQCFKFE
jgi:hypothetical protein